MPDPREPLEVVGDAIGLAVKFAQGVERLGAIMYPVKASVEAASAAHDVSPDLAPEIHAIITQLGEVLQTVTRGITFLEAQLDAELAKLRDSI